MADWLFVVDDFALISWPRNLVGISAALFVAPFLIEKHFEVGFLLLKTREKHLSGRMSRSSDLPLESVWERVDWCLAVKDEITVMVSAKPFTSCSSELTMFPYPAEI